jgi:hypothetical protein
MVDLVAELTYQTRFLQQDRILTPDEVHASKMKNMRMAAHDPP